MYPKVSVVNGVERMMSKEVALCDQKQETRALVRWSAREAAPVPALHHTLHNY